MHWESRIIPHFDSCNIALIRGSFSLTGLPVALGLPVVFWIEAAKPGTR